MYIYEMRRGMGIIGSLGLTWGIAVFDDGLFFFLHLSSSATKWIFTARWWCGFRKWSMFLVNNNGVINV